jgi:hypothetical protein
VTALLGTAVAVASELFTDATLSSNVNAPTSVDAGEATAFDIKIWVTGNVQDQAGKGDVDIVTKYTMNSSGVITPSTSPGDIVRKTFSPGQYSGGDSICGGTTPPVGCQANPIVVNATLSVASGAAAGTDGTLKVDAIPVGGSGVNVATTSEDTGYVEVSGPTDATAPNAASISINDNAAWTNNTGVTVDLAANDAVGITRYRLAATQAGLGSAADVAVNPAQASFTATDVAYTLASGDGTKTIWARFCDAANNCTDVSDTIGLDTVKPTITGQRTPAANSNGWNNTDVTVSFQCADNTGGSGVDTDTNSVAGATVSTEGTNQSVENTGTCTDNAGNVADPATVSNINIDKTKPTITGQRTPAANSNGWNSSDVTVSFQCADNTGGSGLDTPNTVAGQTVSAEGANQSVTNTGTCTDKAGNVADSATVSNINIDLTDPSVAITSPLNGTTTIASSITVSGTDSDTPSDISGVTVNGSPATLGTGAAAGTFSKSGVALTCGSNTITAVATDLADRTRSASITVNRACFGIQYLQPLDQSTTTPVMNQGKYGRVIPVKVLLSLQAGSGLTQADLTANGWTLQIGVKEATCNTGASLIDAVEAYADAGSSNGGTNLFRYDATGGHWIYNLDTKAPPSVTMALGKCYRLDAYISDGTNRVLVSSTTYALFQPVK